MLKICIIISTTREGRFGDKPRRWVHDAASAREDFEVELLDLRDYPMPFFDEVASNLYAPTTNEVARRWQQKVAEFDGYIFVVAEYNRAPPAVLKNALDYSYPEWNKKPAAFVGYGSVGAARAVEQLRLICIELQMVPLRGGVHLQGGDCMAVMRGERDLASFDYLQSGLGDLLDELAWWGHALRAARDPSTEKAGAIAS